MPDPDAVPNPIEFLTGRWPGWNGATEPDGPRRPWPKFTPDGQVQPFPGVTVVCHVRPGTATYQALIEIQTALKSRDFSRHFAYLPPPSFHMTLFDLSNEARRGTSAWPMDVPGDADWPTVSDIFAARLADLRVPAFQPVASGLFGGFSLIIEGQQSAMEGQMRAARDALRQASQVYREDHDSYVFHVTLAYPLRFLHEDDARAVDETCRALFEVHKSALQPIAIGPAELCDFKDMHAFTPRLTFPGADLA